MLALRVWMRPSGRGSPSWRSSSCLEIARRLGSVTTRLRRLRVPGRLYESRKGSNYYDGNHSPTRHSHAAR